MKPKAAARISLCIMSAEDLFKRSSKMFDDVTKMQKPLRLYRLSEGEWCLQLRDDYHLQYVRSLLGSSQEHSVPRRREVLCRLPFYWKDVHPKFASK